MERQRISIFLPENLIANPERGRSAPVNVGAQPAVRFLGSRLGAVVIPVRAEPDNQWAI